MNETLASIILGLFILGYFTKYFLYPWYIGIRNIAQAIKEKKQSE